MTTIESHIVADLQHYLRKKEEDKAQNNGSWEPIDKRKFVLFDLALTPDKWLTIFLCWRWVLCIKQQRMIILFQLSDCKITGIT